MTTIALFGAGGKMGLRLSRNLRGSRFSVRHVEVSAAGRDRLRAELGFECVSPEAAMDGAEVAILAVPDTLIGRVSAAVAPLARPGTMLVILDAAAPFAGHLPDRADLTVFVTHPCHPPIFNEETDPQAKRDFFGGTLARQHVVCALARGPESAWALGEEIARAIYAPVLRAHRMSLEAMAILEPGLSETVCASLLVVMREAMEEAVRRGVPAEAARDFLLGHMNILGAVIFREIDGVFSDACNKAIEFGKPVLMREDWKRVFEPAELMASIRRIT